MSKFREVFPKKNTFLAAVHSEDVIFDLDNIDMAFDAGVDGIFLVNHRSSARELMENYKVIREKYPEKWIGVNLLGTPLKSIFDYVTMSVNGLWTDNAFVKVPLPGQNTFNPAANFLVEKLDWPGLYFGGTCFKGQSNYKDDPAIAAVQAKDFMDVVTTSGYNTGVAAEPEKLIQMKNALEGFPLAIASGTTPVNAYAFSDYVDVYIIGSWLYEGHYTSYNKDKFQEKYLKEMVHVFEQLNS